VSLAREVGLSKEGDEGNGTREAWTQGSEKMAAQTLELSVAVLTGRQRGRKGHPDQKES